jgi:hypothetical protein
MPLAWWASLVMGIPAFGYVGAAIKGTITEPFLFSSWCAGSLAVVFALVLGPIEEFGWRGVALPLLQRRFGPLWAGLILCTVWALWHGPVFFLSGTPQGLWSFAPYFIGVVTISVILTPMFNAVGGSTLIAALFHFQMMNTLQRISVWLTPGRMMRTYGPAKGFTQPLLHAWRMWVTINAIRCNARCPALGHPRVGDCCCGHRAPEPKIDADPRRAVTEVLMPKKEGSSNDARIAANS